MTAQKVATPTANVDIGDVLQSVLSPITNAIQSVLSSITSTFNTAGLLIKAILSGNVADIYLVGIVILFRILGVSFI